MKKRTAFIVAILSLITSGQSFIIKASVVLSASGLMLSIPKEAKSESATYYFDRAMNKYWSEDFYGALLDINRAINISPNKYYYGIRSQIKIKIGDKSGACDDLEKAISMVRNSSKDRILFSKYNSLKC